MGVTISTHNGSAVAREQNIRNPKVVSKEAHIKPNGEFEIWLDEKPRDAYRRIFGSAVAEYNTRQKRSDRIISDYYKNICNDKKKHPVYEMIVGVYGKNEDGSPICTPNLGKQILREFFENWSERNPGLELIGAYYHADEDGEPHIHLDYIPVAQGYTNGPRVQNGLVKALGQQGFVKQGKQTAQIQWEKRENDYLTSLCESVSLSVDHPLIEGRKHIETATFKARMNKSNAESVLQNTQEKLQQIRKKYEHNQSVLKQQKQIFYQRKESMQEKENQLQSRINSAQTSLDQLNGQIQDAEKRLEALQGKVLTTNRSQQYLRQEDACRR